MFIQSILRQVLAALVSIALIVFGISGFADNPALLAERVRMIAPWAKANWVSILLVAVGSATLAVLLWEMWRERQFQTRLREEVERASGADYRESDALAVLNHIKNESSWAWQEFAKLNFWEMVDAYEELRRAAAAGDVRISGEKPNTSIRVKPISIVHWRLARISPLVGTSYGVYSSLNDAGLSGVPGETNLFHLRVSVADVERVWPHAGKMRRLRALLVVWLRRALVSMPREIY